MSKGFKLTEYEIGQIDLMISLNWSQRKIAAEIKRSKTAVYNYLSQRGKPVHRLKPGPKKKIGPRTAKKLLKLASNKTISCRKLKELIGFKGSEKTILRALHDSSVLIFAKLRGKPVLSPEHKITRFDYALKHVNWDVEWNKVIFSDEKKFNLDGPDGFHYYWHNTEAKPLACSKRVLGGGGVMIWIGFCQNGKTAIHFIESTMNSRSYVSLLKRALIPFAEEILDNDFIFQQDNAPCHRAGNTQDFFENRGIQVMEWPARSPDLNPVENLFGLLARRVYEDGRQFQTINQLKTAIILAWDSVEKEITDALVGSMPKRMLEVLKVLGDSIKY